MIAVNLIIAAIIIGKLYQIKPIDKYPQWLIVFLVMYVFINSFIDSCRERSKVESLEKLIVEITKHKLEEK